MDEAVDQLRADYDTSSYESHAFPQSAPGHLAAVAHLFGLDVPEVSTARVLEIGCSAGGNLTPFAAWHPEARAVGIDLSRCRSGRAVSGWRHSASPTSSCCRPTSRRAEIVRGDAEPHIYNTWHESVPLSATDRHLLPLLDGTHDRDALIATLLDATREGYVAFERDGQSLSAEADVRGAAEGHVDTLAERLTEMKLWREVEARHSRFR